jgi:hypothetical protein
MWCLRRGCGTDANSRELALCSLDLDPAPDHLVEHRFGSCGTVEDVLQRSQGIIERVFFD